MKCAVIHSSQLCDTGRWDASYNIAYAENEQRIKELLSKYDIVKAEVGYVAVVPGSELAADWILRRKLVRRHLLRLAISVPLNKEAFYAVVAHGQHKEPGRNPDRKWLLARDNQELAVYVSIAVTKANIEAAMQDLEAAIQKAERTSKHKRHRLAAASKECQ